MSWQSSSPHDQPSQGSLSLRYHQDQPQRGADGTPVAESSAPPSRPSRPFQAMDQYQRGPSPSYSRQSSYPGAPPSRPSPPPPHTPRSSSYEASRSEDYPYQPPPSSYGSPRHQRPQPPHRHHLGPPPPPPRGGQHQQYFHHPPYTPQGSAPLSGPTSSPLLIASAGSSQGSPIADAYKTGGCTCKKSRYVVVGSEPSISL